jgi:hypothetical protein
MVYVAREKLYQQPRLTVWKLIKRPARGWYSVGQWISKGSWRRFPEKFGVRLSDSKIDQELLRHANAAS